MTDDELRLSDSEREAAAADLGEHYAQGRLTAEEHAERLERIWAARTRGEVPPIFTDLPSPYAAVAAQSSLAGPSSAPAWRSPDRYLSSGLRPFRRGVPAPIVLVLAVLIGLTVISHLPFILVGLGVFWFVMLRHRGWHRRQGWR